MQRKRKINMEATIYTHLDSFVKHEPMIKVINLDMFQFTNIARKIGGILDDLVKGEKRGEYDLVFFFGFVISGHIGKEL